MQKMYKDLLFCLWMVIVLTCPQKSVCPTFCSENQIVLIALHPNSTHLLQPADVSVFRPLKAGWSVITRKWRIDHYPEEVTRKTFAPLLKEAFDSRATSEIVKNGFKATGIHPQ